MLVNQPYLWPAFDMVGWRPSLVGIKYLESTQTWSGGEMRRDWTKCGVRMTEEMNLRNIYEGCGLGINHVMMGTLPYLPLQTVSTPFYLLKGPGETKWMCPWGDSWGLPQEFRVSPWDVSGPFPPLRSGVV